MTDLTYALYARISAAWLSLRDNERGQGMVEYALILALVALICVGVLATLGGLVKSTLQGIVNGF